MHCLAGNEGQEPCSVLIKKALWLTMSPHLDAKKGLLIKRPQTSHFSLSLSSVSSLQEFSSPHDERKQSVSPKGEAEPQAAGSCPAIPAHTAIPPSYSSVSKSYSSMFYSVPISWVFPPKKRDQPELSLLCLSLRSVPHGESILPRKRAPSSTCII